MSIKTKVQDKNETKKFPKLMKLKNDDLILLMVNESMGTVIVPGSKNINKVGYYSNVWDIKNFIDFEGSIKLSNN